MDLLLNMTGQEGDIDKVSYEMFALKFEKLLADLLIKSQEGNEANDGSSSTGED